MIPNAFEWIILILCFILIAALMNMFPICRRLAEKKLGISNKDKG
jgi:hypothetical protein